MSLPTRERGLKSDNIYKVSVDRNVAPHAGAWIEMLQAQNDPQQRKESLPTRERGLK